MSWSVSLIGRAPAVLEAARVAFATCNPKGECEKVALKAAIDTVACLIGNYPSGDAVKIDASCSEDAPKKDGAVSQCCIAVTPVYGFVA